MPLPTPVALEWIGPERISEVSNFFGYAEMALAADGSGAGHIVAGSHDGIEYMTNSSGRWRHELITRAHAGGYDGSPAIAIDSDGSITVVFSRHATWECEPYWCSPGSSVGIAMVSREAHGWSEPVTVVGGDAWDPSVAVRDGQTHIAYHLTRKRDEGLYYGRQINGEWTAQAIADEGTMPTIELASDGSPRLAFLQDDMDAGGSTLLWAIGNRDGSSFALEIGPTLHSYGPPLIAFDSDEHLHLIGPNESGASHYWSFHDGDWTEPVQVFGGNRGLSAGAASIGSEGVLYVVSYVPNDEQLVDGVWYAAGRGGQFISEVLWPHEITGTVDGPQNQQAIATDGLGRPHVAFTMITQAGAELWYAIGEPP